MDLRKFSGALALALLVAASPAALAKDHQGHKSKNKGQRNERFTQEFSRFDRNGDGLISRSEFPGDPALFERLDRNQDGVVSQSEGQVALNDRNFQREELQRLDRNGDGLISRSEWNGDSATFDRLDRNRDGVLSQADRGSNMKGAGSRFRGMDRNQDGRVTRDEWRGNDNSFRRQDRNGDGVLSGRELSGKGRKQQ